MCCKQCKVQSVILQEWPLLLTSTMRHSPTAAAFLLHSAASVVVISSAILFVADINNCVWQSKRGVSNPPPWLFWSFVWDLFCFTFQLHNMVNIFFSFFGDDQFDYDFQFAGFIGFLSRVLTQMKMFFDD